MKRTIQIQEVCNVLNSGVEFITRVVDKDTQTVLSSCQTSFDNSNEMFAAVESGTVKNEVKVYKEFNDVDEDEAIECIKNIAYDEWIEKKLIYIDYEDVK